MSAMPKRASARDELISAYIAGLELTVICLSDQPDPACIAFEMAPWPGPEISGKSKLIGAFAFTKASHGELVMSRCGFGAIHTAEAALSTFHAAVAAVGAHWRSFDEILKMAGADIDEIERHLKAWGQAGGLSAFNKAYKRYRQLCIATSMPAIAYSAYLHGFKLKVADLVGKNVAAGANKFAGMASLRPDPPPEIKRRDHFTTERPEKYNDMSKTGRSYVMPGWTHPQDFPRRKSQT